MNNDPIAQFDGDFRWLSNFWLCPVIYGRFVFPSTENAYQAAKLPVSEREKFTTCSPSQAKSLGKEAVLHNNWDKLKLEVMLKVNRQKFQKNTWNSTLLVATGEREIIEGNSWGDTFWGECDGRGENNLGLILMRIRRELN